MHGCRACSFSSAPYLNVKLVLLLAMCSQIVVVADNLESIAEEVRKFAPSYDFVLTTGGVGPTHDYVTLEGTHN